MDRSFCLLCVYQAQLPCESLIRCRRARNKFASAAVPNTPLAFVANPRKRIFIRKAEYTLDHAIDMLEQQFATCIWPALILIELATLYNDSFEKANGIVERCADDTDHRHCADRQRCLQVLLTDEDKETQSRECPRAGYDLRAH